MSKSLCKFMLLFTLGIVIIFDVSVSWTWDDNNDESYDAFQPNSPFNSMQFQSHEQYPGRYNVDNVVEAKSPDIPVIVWWTDRLYPHGFVDNHKHDDVALVTCPQNVQCYSTKSRNLMKDQRTRGILFYGSDFDTEDMPLPREKHHEWALFHEESPLNNYMLTHLPFIRMFNHTATFRRESDYPLTSQNIYSLKYLTERQPVPLSIKNAEKEKRNLAPVMYAQSHNAIPADRDRYVKELMKYIKIDSYGTCLHNRDLPEDLRIAEESFEKDAFLDYISVYKFHLAFENAICKDYMTEKLMRPIRVGSVPIYRGSSAANDWMPNNKTVIMVDDFESPKELAEFIDFLDKNDEAYEEYMAYKGPGGITNQFLVDHIEAREWDTNPNLMSYHGEKLDFFKGFECHICRKLNERFSIEREQFFNPMLELLPPKMANISHLGCQQPYPSVGNPEDIPKKDPWHDDAWISIYWEEYDKAKAVQKMIEVGETNSKTFLKYWMEVSKHKRHG